MARSMGRTIQDRMEEALRKVEGAFSIVDAFAAASGAR
jgi:amidophosphoribosyltransferase